MGTITFGQAAISLGLATEANVQECTLVQQKMREMGVDEPLGEIMIKKGCLSAQQHQQVLKKLGIHVSPIPGYTILSKIGQGGMGTVYKATQSSVNRTVAIKIMSALATKEPTYVARFLQEAQAAGNLNHKNLIAAIDAGAAGGFYYFVMEFVTGKSCRELVNATGVFDEKSAIDIALQMADVLGHIHQHKMVHRDIKPENILLTPDMKVKLCDLGLAKSTLTSDQSLTQEGLAVGTPYFMSPEQIRGEKDVDIRADLYSLGATLFFLVTQRHPFEGKSAAETMSMHLKQAVPDVQKWALKLSEDFAQVIHKLMAKDRAERYQTPLDLAEDLKKIQSGTAPRLARLYAAHHAPPKPATTQRFVRTPRKQVSTHVAVASVLAVGACVAWLIWGGSGQDPLKPAGRPTSSPLAATAAAETKGPEKLQDDPAKVRRASQLFAQAEQAYAAERWPEAREALSRLHTEFGLLQFTRDRSVSIGKMIGVCDGAIQGVTEARNRQIRDARRDLEEGRWTEAYARFLDLAKAGAADFSSELARCRAEVEAEALVGQLRAAQEASNWTEIRQKVQELEQRYPESDTVAKRRAANQGLLSKAAVELETGEMIANAFAAYVKLEWTQSQTLLAEVEKHRDSDAYRANETRIRALAEQLSAGMAKQTEDQARQAWAVALQSYEDYLSARRYDDAILVLRMFQRGQALTKFCESKHAEVDTKIAEAGRRKAKEREEEAKRLWSIAQRDIKAQNYESALLAVTHLLGDLADTPLAKANERTLRQFKTLCEQSQGIPENLLVLMEFEDFPGNWNTHGGAMAQNGLEAYQGKRAARLMLPQRSWVSHPIQGLTFKAETVSFYARSLRKAPLAVVHAWFSDEDFTYQGPPVSIGPEWKLCTFKMAEFKTDSPKAKQKTIVAFDKIRSIGWGPGADAGDCEIQIDALKVESSRR